MDKKIFVLFSVFWIAASITLLGEPLDKPNPVISPEEIAASFNYQGEVKLEESFMGDGKELQHLIFAAEDKSFYRVHIKVGTDGGVIIPEFQNAINRSALEYFTLDDGTKAYIEPMGQIMMMKSKDGRFELFIGADTPDENIPMVLNDKNKQMLGDGSEAVRRSMLMNATQKIYNTVSHNYDRLKREDKEVVAYHEREMAPISTPLVSSNEVIAPKISKTTNVPPKQASEVNASVPLPTFDPWLWLFGGFLILIVVAGLVILFRK